MDCRGGGGGGTQLLQTHFMDETIKYKSQSKEELEDKTSI